MFRHIHQIYVFQGQPIGGKKKVFIELKLNQCHPDIVHDRMNAYVISDKLHF